MNRPSNLSEVFALLASLDWRPFAKHDYAGYAGAGDDAQIAHRDGYEYVRSLIVCRGEESSLCFECCDPSADDGALWAVELAATYTRGVR